MTPFEIPTLAARPDHAEYHARTRSNHGEEDENHQ